MVSKKELNMVIDDFKNSVDITLDFEFEAQPQLRPRATSIGGKARVYDPKKTSDFKKQVKATAQNMIKNHMLEDKVQSLQDRPLGVVINTYHPMPESWSKKKKMQMRGMYKTSKPDSDNLGKPILDALNGVLWHDDAVIADLTVVKQFVDATDVYATDNTKTPYAILQGKPHFTLNVYTL